MENGSVIKSIYGKHYPWSNNNAKSGPDTCNCYITRRQHKNVVKLINLYNYYYNKENKENIDLNHFIYEINIFNKKIFK